MMDRAKRKEIDETICKLYSLLLAADVTEDHDVSVMFECCNHPAVRARLKEVFKK